MKLGEGTTCAEGLCQPTGACCIALTCEIATEADCLAQNGSYFGPGTECYANICSQDLVRGACCVDGQCSEVFQLTCAILGGAWLGPVPRPLSTQSLPALQRVKCVRSPRSMGMSRNWPVR